MFGILFRNFLLAAVALIAVMKVEEVPEYSPWCRCKVQAQLIPLLPRPVPSRSHRRFKKLSLYLTLLLILLAGDVELNPGPAAGVTDPLKMAKIDAEKRDECTSKAICSKREEKVADPKCSLCNASAETLTLRSRSIPDTMMQCSVPDCTISVHYRCIDGLKDPAASWTCLNHLKTHDHHQQDHHDRQQEHQHHQHRQQDHQHRQHERDHQQHRQQDHQHRQHRCASHSSTSTEDTSTQHLRAEPEPIPGPSFASVNMMDIMEALRLTQLKIDNMANDVAEIKGVVQTLLARDGRSSTPSRQESTSLQDSEADSAIQRRQNCPTAKSHGVSKTDICVIGDSNVRRLETSDVQSRTSFRSISGAATKQVEQELDETSDASLPSHIVLHVGTNDLPQNGSETIATNVVKLAQYTKARPGVKHVYICSVTPRTDLGSFIFSRSESVNNRLHSLCSRTPGVEFIDLRQQLNRCPFNGLTKDALHYNKSGASHALHKIAEHTGAFLA